MTVFSYGDKNKLSQHISQHVVICYPAIGDNHETEAEKNYQDIILRKKLLNIARAQSEEILVLRAELEKLRMKNFPSLSQLQYN